MIKQPTISSFQMVLLGLASALMFPYTSMPILTTFPYNQDAWIVLCCSSFYVVLLHAPLVFLMNKFRGLNLNETFETISGKPIGKIFALSFALLFFMCCCVCLSEGIEFINITLMSLTPRWALLVACVIPIVFVAFRGAGVLARISVVIVPIILFTIVLFGIAGIKDMHLDYLKPILGDSSFWDINKGAFLTAVRFSEVSILFVFSYFLKSDAKIVKIYFAGLAVFFVFIMIMLLSILLTLSYDVASLAFNPYYVFSRQVKFAEGLGKLQILNAIAWFPGLILKISIYLFMISFILNRTFKKVTREKFTIAIGVLIIVLGLIKVLDDSFLIKFLASDKFFPYPMVFTIFIIPLTLVIIYFLRKRKIDEKYRNFLDRIDLNNDINTNALKQTGSTEIKNPE